MISHFPSQEPVRNKKQARQTSTKLEAPGISTQLEARNLKQESFGLQISTFRFQISDLKPEVSRAS
jgi:hypothetical protein